MVAQRSWCACSRVRTDNGKISDGVESFVCFNSPMAAVLLYIATAIATGLQLWRLLWQSIWGAPIHRLEYVALLGAAVLLVAGGLRIWTTRSAVFAVVSGVVLLWAFYAPLLYTMFRKPPEGFRFDNAATV